MLKKIKPLESFALAYKYAYIITNHKTKNMNKHELRREFKDQIDEVFHNIQKLENKSKELSGIKREELSEKIKELQAKKDQMDTFYEELLNSTEEKAEEINTHFQKSLVNFKEGFNEIAEAF